MKLANIGIHSNSEFSNQPSNSSRTIQYHNYAQVQ